MALPVVFPNWLEFDGRGDQWHRTTRATGVSMEPNLRSLESLTVEAWVRLEEVGAGTVQGPFLSSAPSDATFGKEYNGSAIVTKTKGFNSPGGHPVTNLGLSEAGLSVGVEALDGQSSQASNDRPIVWDGWDGKGWPSKTGWEFIAVTFTARNGVFAPNNVYVGIDRGVLIHRGKFGSEARWGPWWGPAQGDWSRLWLGRSPCPPGGLIGGICQVSVWQGERSQDQIQEDSARITPDSSLLGWWPLNEGSGTRVLDHSGRGNHGRVSGPDIFAGTDGDRHWATNKVVLQVTRNPRQPDAGKQNSYIFPGMPKVNPDGTAKMSADGKKIFAPVPVYDGDEVEWLFTDSQIDSKSVDPHGTGPAGFWASGAPHEAGNNPRQWVATVGDHSDGKEYDFDVTIKEGGVQDTIDPGLKCKGRRGKGKGTKTGRVGN